MRTGQREMAVTAAQVGEAVRFTIRSHPRRGASYSGFWWLLGIQLLVLTGILDLLPRALKLLVLAVLMAVMILRADWGLGALVVDAKGVRSKSLIGRWGARSIAWSELRAIVRDTHGTLLLVRHDRRPDWLPIDQFGDADEIAAAIARHFPFDTTSPGRPSLKNSSMQAVALLLLAGVLLLWKFAVVPLFLAGWHFYAEPLHLLLVFCLPLGVALAWWRIWPEGKPDPLPTAVVSGLLLGLVFTGVLLDLNRIATEWRQREDSMLLRLVHTSRDGRKWEVVAPPAGMHLPARLRFEERWQGYASPVQVGETWRVTVWRGWLNDIALPPGGLQAIERVEAGR